MSLVDSSFVVFVAVLILQWLAAYAGDVLRRKLRPFKKEGERQDFDIIRTASLTLLGLIIGFTFAMAVSRYDQRKNLEEAEANAIGTEYARADLLPADDAEACARCSGNTATSAVRTMWLATSFALVRLMPKPENCN